MKKRILGKDLEVSAVSLGCMGFTHAYGPAMDEKEAAKVIPAQISLAWMISKKPYIVPIPGSRKIERVRENAGAAFADYDSLSF